MMHTYLFKGSRYDKLGSPRRLLSSAHDGLVGKSVRDLEGKQILIQPRLLMRVYDGCIAISGSYLYVHQASNDDSTCMISRTKFL